MKNELPPQDKKNPLRAFLEENRTKILQYINTSDPSAQQRELEKIIDGVVRKVSSDKNLKNCKHPSILSCLTTALGLGFMIDERQHVYITGNDRTGIAELKIGYRGYINKVKQVYPDAHFDISFVKKGDVYEPRRVKNKIEINHIMNGAFNDNEDDVLGIYCLITFTQEGRECQHLENMSLKQIQEIKGCAKQNYVWQKWWTEQAKKSVIRRACKIHFASETEPLDQYDNDDFDLTEPTCRKTDSIVDKNNNVTSSDKIDPEIKETPAEFAKYSA